MALRLLTIAWEGLQSRTGAESLDRMAKEVKGKRTEIAALLLDIANHPGRWNEDRYAHVGKLVSMEGNHGPKGDHICSLEIVFDDECMDPEEAVRKIRAYFQANVFFSIELTIGTKEVPNNDPAYADFWAN